MLKIITDSAADLEPEEIEKTGIICVPNVVSFGGLQYKENVNLTKRMFYKLLNIQDEFPHTSCPSPYDFKEALDRADEDDGAIIITVSSHLSGAFQNAVIAQKLSQMKNCYVFDSLSAAGGQRILVEHAEKLRDEGLSAGQIYARLKRLRRKIAVFACLNNLDYLCKGGRISRGAAMVGTAARIKPIISLSDGELKLTSKVIGLSRGLFTLAKALVETPPDPKYPLCVMYTQKRETAVKLAEILRKFGFSVPDSRIVNVGAAIGSHIGSGSVGVAYAEKV